MRKIPMRMCTGCRQMFPKNELLRVALTQSGDVSVDKTGKAPGRGAYICKNRECLDKAIKTHAFDRAFETRVPKEILEKLKEDVPQVE